MNFRTRFKQGQSGANAGLPMGMPKVQRAVGGVQRARYYTVASAPKVGKSTFINQAFLYEPWLEAMKHNLNVRWIYYSFEMSRVYQEFCAMAYFLYHEYGVDSIELEEGTVDGKKTITLNVDYLLGQVLYDKENEDDPPKVVLVKPQVEEAMELVYEKYIVKLFGRYDESGKLLEHGYVTVIETALNPTGLFRGILDFAKARGRVIEVKSHNNLSLVSGYIPNDPNEQVIIICDHVRKIKSESGFNEKQTMDKWSNYCIILRDALSYSFVNIVHLNRTLSDVQRLKAFGDMLYPDSDMVKGSGNMAEDCDHMITLFNPNDNRYNLTTHFGQKIRSKEGDELYPGLRTVHLVESRHAVFPQHWAVTMRGHIKRFDDNNPFGTD